MEGELGLHRTDHLVGQANKCRFDPMGDDKTPMDTSEQQMDILGGQPSGGGGRMIHAY